MRRTTTFNLSYLPFAGFGVLLVHNLWVTMQAVAPIPCSDFQKHLKDKKVNEVVVTAQDVRGEFTEPIDGESRLTTRVAKDLAALVEEHKVKLTGQVERAFLATVLSWVVPILLFILVRVFFVRRMAERFGGSGGMLSIGKSKAKIYVETNIKTTFADVAGVDESKTESMRCCRQIIA